MTPDGELRSLLAAVAHDLRTPLAAIAGEVELALVRVRPMQEYREALARIGTSARELIELTGDLGLLAEETATAETASLEGVLERVAAQYASAGVHVDAAGARGCRVPGRAQALERALGLLVDDVRRVDRSGRPVVIACREPSVPSDGTPGPDILLTVSTAGTTMRRSLRFFIATGAIGSTGGSLSSTADAAGTTITIRLNRVRLQEPSHDW
jgi:signal transduction histidine kinase